MNRLRIACALTNFPLTLLHSYVGTLVEINPTESTVSLENVKSHGTEGRKADPADEVQGSPQIYEFIVFRGSDVKDLRVDEAPAPKENLPPQMPNDPAIVGVSTLAPSAVCLSMATMMNHFGC